MKKLFLMVLFAAAAFGQERYLKPVDEAAQDASFLAFRTKLIAATERKDAKYLLSIVDPGISNDFAGTKGIASFKKEWKLEQKNSKFWGEFLPVIKNGGKFDGEGANKMKHFSAPYTYSAWPEDLDGFIYSAIGGENVNLRTAPNTNAEIVGKLSYNIVKTEDQDGVPEGWDNVSTLGGMSGYVKSEFVKREIGYRAGFEKKRGKWVMTFFVAGD